ncbi:MAG TPA: hypothetical protein VMW49_07655, partial [Candidatus Dormibacteraeota bacterium]|nr:hypothetical protein [Candidatus Dormibacteraeota bacterium]
LANRLLCLLRTADGPTFWGRDWPAVLAFTALRSAWAATRHPGALRGLWWALRWAPWAWRSRRQMRPRRRAAPGAVDAWVQPTPWARLLRRR